MTQSSEQSKIEVLGEPADDVLTPAARALLVDLVRAFGPRRDALLAERAARQARLDDGSEQLDFARTAPADAWRVAEIPADLRERKVEITGPPEKKMVVNALSSGASCFMADFEDATAPTWKNLIEGQRTLARAARRDLSFTDEKTGKSYALDASAKLAVLIARPRGLHLNEAHVKVDGRAVPAALFDAALYVLHNARALEERGSGAYLYLPKLEAPAEAAWWHDVLTHIERAVGLADGSVKVTVLIETLPAAFCMDEILYALRERCVGLNCGRWDYIFSSIKRRRAERVLTPDRGQMTMEQPFMRAYAQLLIKTCHKRGAFAMGGMSAYIPRKDDADKNAAALEKVRQDKLREVKDGHDGTWVAHPGLVPVARQVFDDALGDKPNQLDVLRSDVKVTRYDLLAPPAGTRSEVGVRQNVRVAITYLASWLAGQGCVPIEGLMEDAATAEISRAQLWQWLKHGADINGRPLTKAWLEEIAREETARMDHPRTAQARALFLSLVQGDVLDEFLTVPAYQALVNDGA
jgi:malate synthase